MSKMLKEWFYRYTINVRLSLYGGQVVFAKNILNCHMIRRFLLTYQLKFCSTINKPKEMLKRSSMVETKFGLLLDKVIFTNDCWTGCTITHSKCTSTNKFTQWTVKHQVKVYIWGYFSRHMFIEKVNTAKMIKIYQNTTCPWVIYKPKILLRYCKKKMALNIKEIFVYVETE